MSEVKLNLTDSQQTIHGTIHGSIADRCVAALSAEPETIGELEAALSRYIKPLNGISHFGWFRIDTEIDDQPWDAGIVIIDLAARIVAAESTYSQPGPNGQVDYHDGNCATDIIVFYRVPDDWLFLNSVEEYRCRRTERVQRRRLTPPLDTRAVLYGRPLLEFISNAVADASAWDFRSESETNVNEPNPLHEALVSAAHIQWLMTPRDDLRGKSPREVLLEKQDFIDYDLHTRSMQWSLLGEGPPCLAMDSFAYRYAGFGTHEWVIYYDLVRHLLCKALDHVRQTSVGRQPEIIDHINSAIQPVDKLKFLEQEIARLEEIKRDWLETPQQEYGGRTPAILIQSERRRLPITISGRQLIIDEACPVCQMMAAESELRHEVSFWHLDGSHMDDDFIFSPFLTREEWEADRREWKAFTEKFNREWEERHRRELRDQTAGELIMDEKDDLRSDLIPPHGGYRNLKSFQLAQLVYDLTVRFCDRYSRTHDQMVQAARSGVQNIAEGSVASGTSKKTELKLTNVARASLEELRLDYQDFLRQRGLKQWARADRRRAGLIALRPTSADEVAAWAQQVRSGRYGHDGRGGRGEQSRHDGRGQSGDDGQSTASIQPSASISSTASIRSTASITSTTSIPSIASSYAEISANGALALIAVASSLLDRQLDSLEKRFVAEGGFTERLYRVRSAKRNEFPKKRR